MKEPTRPEQGVSLERLKELRKKLWFSSCSLLLDDLIAEAEKGQEISMDNEKPAPPRGFEFCNEPWEPRGKTRCALAWDLRTQWYAIYRANVPPLSSFRWIRPARGISLERLKELGNSGNYTEGYSDMLEELIAEAETQ